MNWNERIDRRAVFIALGLKGEKLPADFEGVFKDVKIYHRDLALSKWVFTRLQMVTTLIVKPLIRGSKKHRTFIVCPKCFRNIPTGRWHQHVGTETCKRDTAALESIYKDIGDLL